MSEERQPDETCRVAVEGGEVTVYSYGTRASGSCSCLHGGPGLPCDYVRDSHSVMADHGYRVVAYDQLGCGQSDKPDDTSLFNVARYVDEVEAVRVRARARSRAPPRAILGNLAGHGLLPEIPGQRRVVWDRERLRQRAAHRL